MFLRLRIRYVQLLDTLDELSDVFGLQLFVWLSLMFFHTCVKVFLYAKYKVISNESVPRCSNAFQGCGITLTDFDYIVDFRRTFSPIKWTTSSAS